MLRLAVRMYPSLLRSAGAEVSWRGLNVRPMVNGTVADNVISIANGALTPVSSRTPPKLATPEEGIGFPLIIHGNAATARIEP